MWGRNVGGMLEVKNVEKLSMSDQLRAQIQRAGELGQPFNLVVSPKTQYISGPLLEAIEEIGGSIYRYDPATGILTEF
ncbi:MAG: hypothetical protein LBB55_05650 [Zoogloeaceae bacterium]|jgi:filamentous hemagglutinin|nr:hypothetical protein [Zoogloeaceae bacterium]